MESRGRKGC